MKSIFFTIIAAILILTGCQAYGSTKRPEPANQHSGRIENSLSHYMITPSRCSFV